MDDTTQFETSFPAGRKQIFVDVKENDFGTYCKIKERGGQQTNSILIPSESIVRLRDALNEAIKEASEIDIVDDQLPISERLAVRARPSPELGGSPTTFFLFLKAWALLPCRRALTQCAGRA